MVAKKTSNRGRKNKNSKKSIQPKVEFKAGLLILLALLSLASLIFTEQTGFLGRVLNTGFEYLAGSRAWTIPIFIGILGANLMYYKNIPLNNRFWGISLLLFLIIVGHHVELILEHDLISRGEIMAIASETALDGSGGGLIGAVFATVFLLVLGEIGTFILMIFAAVLAFMLLTDTTFKDGMSLVKKIGLKSWQLLLIANEKLVELYYRLVNVRQKQKYQSETTGELDKEKNVVELADYREGNHSDGSDDTRGVNNTNSANDALEEYPIVSFEKDSLDNTQNTSQTEKVENQIRRKEDEEIESSAISNNFTTQSAKDKESEHQREPSYTFYPNKTSVENYQLPSLSILKKGDNDGNQRTNRRELSDRARLLEETLDSFGVKARVIKVQKGPTITRFELQPDKGVKVSKIVNLSDDVALSLAASEIRIEAPIPGKAAIGIEVPNKEISPVYLREVLESSTFQKSESPLTIAIGKDIAGDPVVADLAKMPHLLIAGSTGSGKSVSINTLIASVLYKARPDEVKLLLVDPKVVELKSFDGLPHLMAPVVTNPKNAASTLKNIVSEMEYRYQLFADTGVRDIAKYNAITKESEEYPDNLPYIVVIIDELADLMMVAPTEVEDAIFRLAQMSRAAGIHLILATQRPSVDVITGVIKSNITSRIAFSVTSQADSRTILDMGGAEKLLGQGDMLFTPMGSNKPMRLQGAFISDKEIDTLTEQVKNQGEPQYQEDLITEPKEDKPSEYDELLPRAIELVSETQQASISLIQRRLRVGYTRAARLVDELENFGVIGGHEGSKPRKILMAQEEISNLLENL